MGIEVAHKNAENFSRAEITSEMSMKEINKWQIILTQHMFPLFPVELFGIRENP